MCLLNLLRVFLYDVHFVRCRVDNIVAYHSLEVIVTFNLLLGTHFQECLLCFLKYRVKFRTLRSNVSHLHVIPEKFVQLQDVISEIVILSNNLFANVLHQGVALAVLHRFELA